MVINTMTSTEFALLANLIAEEANVTCMQSPDEKGIWQANPIKKIIYYPKDTHYTDLDLGYLIHEVGHIRFSKAIPQLNSAKSGKFLKWVEKFGKSVEQIFNLVNAIEDIRVDAKMKSIYKGAGNYLNKSYLGAYEFDKNHKENLALFNPRGLKDMSEASWLHYCKYYLWKDAMGKKGAKRYLKRWNVKQDVLKAIIKSEKIDIVKKAIECKSTQEICNMIMKDVLEIYLPLCDKERKKKGMTKEQFGKMMKELLKEFMEEMKKIEAQIKKGKGGTQEIDNKEMDGKMTEKIKMEKEGKAGKNRSDKTGVGYSKEIFSTKISSYGITKQELIDAVRMNLASVRKAISILKDKEIKRWEGNYESGKLQNRKLYKLKTGVTKIFTRKLGIEEDSKDMVVALLVDESGSMRGSRMGGMDDKNDMRPCDNAAIATTLLSKALEMCGKKHAVFGFNLLFKTHKEFNKKMNYDEMVKISHNASGYECGCNNDGYAINKTVELLKKRPEKHKILIVLSDGEPAPAPGYEKYDLKTEAKNAEKVAKVYGIGIDSNAVKSYYKRVIVIRNPAELGKTLTNIFKETVGKRKR